MYSDENPPATCTEIQETNFKCRTADHDATTNPVTGWEHEFTVATCPTSGTGLAYNLFGWHDVSQCSLLDETTLTCRRTSKCGSNVQGSVENDGGGIDVSQEGNSPYASCQACVTADPYDMSVPVYGCRSMYRQCCGLDADILALSGLNSGGSNPQSGSDYCYAGTMSLVGNRCIATGETACACPANVQTGVSVAKTSCADPVALADYAACGTACGKTYDSSATRWDASGDAFYSITGAVEADGSDSTGVSHYKYEECQGTHTPP